MPEDTTRTFYESDSCDWYPAPCYFKFANEEFENRAISILMFKFNNGLYLDNGCGDGRLINKVINYPVKRIIGMDISRRQLTLAKRKIHDERVDFIRGSVMALPFKDGVFDRLLCWSVLIHLNKKEYRDSALKEMSRTIKQDGKIAINIKNYPALIYHVFSYIYWRLKNLIISSFGENDNGLSKQKIHSSFKKGCYHRVSWNTNEELFLQRFTKNDIENNLAKSNMYFINRFGQGIFLPDGFDVVLEKVMRYKIIGIPLGKTDRVLSAFMPFFTDNIVYFIRKKPDTHH